MKKMMGIGMVIGHMLNDRNIFFFWRSVVVDCDLTTRLLKLKACFFRLEVLMYFIATMPMGRIMRTSKDEHIGC